MLAKANCSEELHSATGNLGNFSFKISMDFAKLRDTIPHFHRTVILNITDPVFQEAIGQIELFASPFDPNCHLECQKRKGQMLDVNNNNPCASDNLSSGYIYMGQYTSVPTCNASSKSSSGCHQFHLELGSVPSVVPVVDLTNDDEKQGSNVITEKQQKNETYSFCQPLQRDFDSVCRHGVQQESDRDVGEHLSQKLAFNMNNVQTSYLSHSVEIETVDTKLNEAYDDQNGFHSQWQSGFPEFLHALRPTNPFKERQPSIPHFSWNSCANATNDINIGHDQSLSSEQLHTCVICGAVSKRRYNLKKHYMTVHSLPERASKALLEA